jgi:hypothetical protein
MPNIQSATLYAAYARLYEDFHWQGATVRSIDHAANYIGVNVEYPFHEEEFIKFMSSVPEHFGRGLELTPTKQFLKETLMKDCDYPFYLQEGPHSYRYDTNPRERLDDYISNAPLGSLVKKLAQANLIKLSNRPELIEIKDVLNGITNDFSMNVILAPYER